MTRVFRLGLFVLLAIATVSCASVEYKRLKRELGDFNPPEKNLEVKFFKQSTDQCGPVSLYTVLNFFGDPTSLKEVEAITFTPGSNGTHKMDMISAGRRLGYSVYRVTLTQAFEAISREMPVIVFHNLGIAWASTWHYSVLVGYSLPSDQVYLHDGHEAYASMKLKRFANTWDRGGKWSYVLTPPEAIPEFADFQSALTNSQIFLKIGQKDDARKVLETMTRRWVDRVESQILLANLYLEGGEVESARRASEKAAELKPKWAGLYFNLATIYVQQGKLDQARQMKTKAKSLANPSEWKELNERFREIDL